MKEVRNLKLLRKKLTSRQALLLLQLLFSILLVPSKIHAQSNNSKEFVVPEIERIRTKEEIQKHVGSLVEKSLKIADLKDKRDPIVNLSLSVDKKKLTQDFLNHQKQQLAQEQQQAQQRWQESTTRFLEFLKAAKDLQRDEQSKQNRTQDGEPSSIGQIAPRFGILNTSGAMPSTTQKQNSTTSNSANFITPNINFSAPISSYQTTPFSYSLLEYLNDIAVEIHLPSELKTELRTELRKSIVTFLNLPVLTNQNSEQKVKFIDLPAPAPDSKVEQPSFIKDLVNPKNQALSGVLMSAAALIGFLLVGLTVIMSGRRLADAVGGLAQATQAKAQGSENEQTDAVAETPSSTELESQNSNNTPKSKFSPDKEADLLAQTRVQIAENVAQWCQKDPVTVGEVLVDLASSKNGTTTLNSLLLYLGYENLKPALELLPNKLLRKLDESLNESWKDGAELLPGLEAAQLLLAGMIPRQTALLRFPFDTGPMRKILLKLDSQALRELALELSTGEFCTIFRILPQGLALNLSNQLSAEKLKELMAGLDQSDANKEPDEDLLKKLENRSGAKTETRGSEKERLIRGMLKTANQSNEDRILDFLGADDLLLRFDLLQERFFPRDLVYIEPTMIRTLIDKMSLSRRANFLYFSDPTLRQSIMDLYPKDSKTLEALVEELENIDKSPKRKAAAANDRSETFSAVTAKLFDMVKSDLSMRISLIEKIAGALNATLPPEITQLANELREGAA